MTINRNIRLVLITTTTTILAAINPHAASAHTVTPTACSAVASLWPTSTTRQRLRSICNRYATRHARIHLCARADLTPFSAIDCTWPASLRSDAKRVADCESTAHVDNTTARARGLGRWASNGEYRGVFQMGDDERATHGQYRVGDDARLQVRSALSLYRSRGWQPWACQP
jgi:hypothetical protein